MTDLNGNIPSHVFYGSIFSEVLRIARATMNYFLPKAHDLFQRTQRQGASKPALFKQIDKMANRHPDAVETFGVNSARTKLDLENKEF